MKGTKKLLVLGVLAFALFGTTAFAAEVVKSPAEIYADLVGITVEEAYIQRGTDKTFGQLAAEAGKLAEFEETMLSNRIAIIEDRVKKGLITRERADELIRAIKEHECNGPGEQHLGQKYGIGFGKGLDDKGFGYRSKIGNGDHFQYGFSYKKNFHHGRDFGRGFGRR